MSQFEQIGSGNAGARQEVFAQRGGNFLRQVEPVIIAANRVAAYRQVGFLCAQQVNNAGGRFDMFDARHITRQNTRQPVKGAGDGSNKAQKNVVNKKKKSGKGDDSDDDEGSKAQKDLMKKKKEEEAAMRAKLGKKK